MYQNVNNFSFIDAFEAKGGENKFSYEALNALFEYYTDLEESTGEQIEFDVIAVCCDWTEHESAQELTDYYDQPLDDILNTCIVIKLASGHYLVME